MNKSLFVLVALFGSFISTSALAATCFDLWVERNAIFKRNGYCFGTTLGKTYFGNNGCWTRNARLSASEQRRVANIKRVERSRGCRVNTRQAYRRPSAPSQPVQRTYSRPVAPAAPRQQNRTFSCVVACATGSAGTNRAGKVTISISAPDRNAGTRYVRQNGTSICRRAGFRRMGYSPGQTFCKF
ncbi:MAG: YARHG domain-containing protein [Pseudomonadota bacterium]